MHYTDTEYVEDDEAVHNDEQEDTGEIEQIKPVGLYTRNEHELVQLTREATASGVFDSGCTTTVCGVKWLQSYMDQLPGDMKDQIKKVNSEIKFQFGGEYILKSQGKMYLPAEIVGVRVTIVSDVVDSDIPLLFSKTAMKGRKPKLIMRLMRL